MAEQAYIGGELELFAQAINWKRYWSSRLQPFIGKQVIEVGAGIGSNTSLLYHSDVERWVCVEPDSELVEKLKLRLDADSRLGGKCKVLQGTLADVPQPEKPSDTILYIDVLEHIENDVAEVALAAACLSPGGSLVVLGPAHQGLYSPFDRAIGHYRRYTTGTLAALTCPGLHLTKAFYLDSVGLIASSANRFLLGQSMPNPGQIKVWDQFMVPLSRILDPITFGRLGKSAVAVWTKL